MTKYVSYAMDKQLPKEVLRGAHAKTNACAKAKWVVDDNVPPALRQEAWGAWTRRRATPDPSFDAAFSASKAEEHGDLKVQLVKDVKRTLCTR